jgi:UDP-N-acetylmuramoyl-tripeptide--D-alanyl-D-alanine ligase
MLELGEDSIRYHQDLADTLSFEKNSFLFTVGPMMRHLHEKIKAHITSRWSEKEEEMIKYILNFIENGDMIFVKGSKGSRVRMIAQKLYHFSRAQEFIS